MKKLIYISLFLSLSSCEWTDKKVGKHLPVLNEENRCYNWQCFGEEGRKISEQNKQKRIEEEKVKK